MIKKILLLGLIAMSAFTNTADANDRVLGIEEYKTDSGITLWHVEDHSLPIMTIHFAFSGAGSVTDPKDMIGLGQLVSNTIDEGAGTRDAHEYQKALQDHAIDLSFNNSRDYFTGKLRTLKRHKDLAIELLRDALHTPRFDKESIDRMRHANMTRIKSSASKPEWLASRLMNDVYFGDHPYAENSGGTISGLKNVTADAMKQFVAEKFSKDNLIISTAGDLSADEAKVIVDQIFADLDGQNEVEPLMSVTPPESSVKKAFKTDSPQSSVVMLWPSIAKTDEDYYALSVMNFILGGGGFSSMLMDEVREQQGLTYGIYSQLAFMDHSNYLMIESAMSPENIEPMMISIEGILSRLKYEAVADDVLADAKSYLVGSLPLRFSTTLSLSGTALRMQLDGRSINALDFWADRINAVTADDVMRVANRIFMQTEPLSMVIAGAVPDREDLELVEIVPGIE